MYSFEPVQVTEAAPWKIETLQDRLSALKRPASLRIAYIYTEAEAGTFRYRCWNMCRALKDYSSQIAGSCFFLSEYEAAGAIAAACDVMVFCRVQWDGRLATFMSAGRAHHCRLLYDIDDFIFDPEFVWEVARQLNIPDGHPTLDVLFLQSARMYAVLRQCDGFITTTGPLAEQLSRCLPTGSGAIVRNSLNDLQIAVSMEALRRKEALGWGRTSEIHIGYFSGSATHARDLQLVTPALGRLTSRNDALRLHLVGFVDTSGELQGLRDRIAVHPMTDPFTLQNLIAATEINIAPLVDNLFTRCKSELKWFEAAVAGSITVATPTPPFSAAIRDGENGFLAEPGLWDEALQRAIETIGDHGFIKRAAEEAVDRFGPAALAKQIEAAFS